MSKKKKLVLSAFVLVGMFAIVGAGTFATFNAQASNPGNVFADGTIVLGNKVGSGTTCLSTGAGTVTDTNNNASCSQLWNLTVRKPGDTGSANVTISNQGSLNASSLQVFTAACTNADVATETYHGTGLPCGKIALTIQQYSDSGFTTPSACVYGGGTATTCAFDTTKTLGTFQSSYNATSNGLVIGSGLASGASAYFKVSVQLPSTADNTFQGRQATADFTWYIAQ
jgi:hypothetical protein